MNNLTKGRIPADLPRPRMVQPFWFGDMAYESTGFNLRDLPALEPTQMLQEPAHGNDERKACSTVPRGSAGRDRWKIGGRTFEGVADAAFDQWGM